MFYIGTRLLDGIRTSGAILIPCCYWLVGLVCLLFDFNWHQVFIVGVVYLFVLFVVQQVAVVYYKPIIFFMGFIFLGLLLFFAAWIVSGSDIYRPFPLALVGCVAWSIVVWECSAVLSCIRVAGRTRIAFPSISIADQFAVLMIPITITGILGVIHAATGDAITLSERFADFFHVAIIGIACGLFLVLPWLSLPFVLKFWVGLGEEKREE